MNRRLSLLALVACSACGGEATTTRKSQEAPPFARQGTLSVVSGTIRWQVGDEIQERALSTEGGQACIVDYEAKYFASDQGAVFNPTGDDGPLIDCLGDHPEVAVYLNGLADLRALAPGVTTFDIGEPTALADDPPPYWKVVLDLPEGSKHGCWLDESTYSGTANVTVHEGETREYPELVSPDYLRRIELSLKTGPFASQSLDADCNAAVEVDLVVEQTADNFTDAPLEYY